jgi:uncharacterized phosphosugar-binding protein
MTRDPQTDPSPATADSAAAAAALPIHAYAAILQEALAAAARDEADAILRAAELVADTVAADGVVHLFGSGHSALVAAECVGRSGALVPLNQVLDRTEDLAERLPGYGRVLAEHYHQQYGLRPGETLVAVSNSGINPLGVDLALDARARGLQVIAITNLRQSRELTSRHGSGQRLFEVADVVLDNHAPFGEAVLELPGVAQRVASVGTITGSFLINAVMASAVQALAARGVEPPILVSENAGLVDADERNAALRRRWHGRLRRAGV